MHIRTHIVAGVAALAAGVASATPAEAAASKHENIGAGTGLLVGAAAGGPVGAIVGVVVGAKLGESYHRKDDTVETLKADLNSSRASEKALDRRVTQLTDDNRQLDDEINKLQSAARPELVAMLQAGLEMDLLFRTDEYVLIDATSDRVRSIAKTLASMDDIIVRIDGYTDERGDAEYNRKLSQRRADHVRDVLVAGGLPESRIRVAAHGESPAADASADSYALERKVSVTLLVADSPAVAARR